MEMKDPTVDAGESATAAGGNGAADPPAEGNASASALESVTVERDRLIEENRELLDRILRRQAEFDNFRRRAEREKSEVLEFAHTDSVRAILPILDDFERAFEGTIPPTRYMPAAWI